MIVKVAFQKEPKLQWDKEEEEEGIICWIFLHLLDDKTFKAARIDTANKSWEIFPFVKHESGWGRRSGCCTRIAKNEQIFLEQLKTALLLCSNNESPATIAQSLRHYSVHTISDR